MTASGLLLYRPTLRGFWWDESGQDLMEYALVAALLSLCAVATLRGLAAGVLALWHGLATGLSSAI